MMQVRTCWAFWDLGKKMQFLVKKNVFSMFQSFYTFFSLSMRIGNNFLITISGDSTTYCSLCILCQKCEFKYFWLKANFHLMQGM